VIPWPTGSSRRNEATLRRVLKAVDADAFVAAVGSWLAGRLRAADQGQGHGRRARRALGVDGKAVRGTRHASPCGQAVHLLAVADQQASAVLAQTSVDGMTNEITRFAPLLEPLDLAGCVITPLRTQREHAAFLVADKKAHYILIVKKNRPACTPSSRTCPGAPSRPATGTTTAAAKNTAPSKPPPLPLGSPSPTPPRPSASPAG
jgi:hypothetical protein